MPLTVVSSFFLMDLFRSINRLFLRFCITITLREYFFTEKKWKKEEDYNTYSNIYDLSHFEIILQMFQKYRCRNVMEELKRILI